MMCIILTTIPINGVEAVKRPIVYKAYRDASCNSTGERPTSGIEGECERFWVPSSASWIYATVNCTKFQPNVGVARSLPQICTSKSTETCSSEMTCHQYEYRDGHLDDDICVTNTLMDEDHILWHSLGISLNCSIPDDIVPDDGNNGDNSSFLADYLPYICAAAGLILVIVVVVVWWCRRKRLATPAIDYDALLDMETTHHGHVGHGHNGTVQDDF
jgi:hypothetical protein